MRFVVLFDSCVLYPAPLRDFLIRLATSGLFAAKWTDEIHNEWIGNLLKNRPALKEQIQRTRRLMDDAVPDCLVNDYNLLIPGLTLPDPDDRHILAAAIKCNAQIIVTFNLKDFPSSALDPFGIEALHPDVFIEHQMSLSQNIVVSTAKNHRASLKNPPKSGEAYLAELEKQGLVITANKLRRYVDLI
ncbi:MAG: PIN domain-containing protein [Deltaproteobacteria bacterium]|nr:PIN domain-containing protein [Deltaproteobacteria bacterium]